MGSRDGRDNKDQGIEVEPGGFLRSDAIPFSVEAADDLVISIYWREAHTFRGLCQTWNAKSWQSSFQEGDQTDTGELAGMATIDFLPFFRFDEHVSNGALGIAGVEILTEEQVMTMACFGDSITHMSYYFDPLLEELYRRYPGQVTLLNGGLGGNRVLYDACRGDSGTRAMLWRGGGQPVRAGRVRGYGAGSRICDGRDK